ncbi:MAG: hypothetical protein KA972_05165, partial [Brachymonas sp.]|nr:hypothetical protein [Brachymonas sp.]
EQARPGRALSIGVWRKFAAAVQRLCADGCFARYLALAVSQGAASVLASSADDNNWLAAGF